MGYLSQVESRPLCFSFCSSNSRFDTCKSWMVMWIEHFYLLLLLLTCKENIEVAAFSQSRTILFFIWLTICIWATTVIINITHIATWKEKKVCHFSLICIFQNTFQKASMCFLIFLLMEWQKYEVISFPNDGSRRARICALGSFQTHCQLSSWCWPGKPSCHVIPWQV